MPEDELVGAKRVRISVTLSPTALSILDELAQGLGASWSDVLEHLVRADNRRESASGRTS
jgi:hypothetical protein